MSQQHDLYLSPPQHTIPTPTHTVPSPPGPLRPATGCHPSPGLRAAAGGHPPSPSSPTKGLLMIVAIAGLARPRAWPLRGCPTRPVPRRMITVMARKVAPRSCHGGRRPLTPRRPIPSRQVPPPHTITTTTTTSTTPCPFSSTGIASTPSLAAPGPARARGASPPPPAILHMQFIFSETLPPH